jgi:cytochrome P450
MTNRSHTLPEPQNIFTDEFFTDPHSVYAKLRENGPVHRVVTPNRQIIWLIIGYEEARAALSDRRLSKDVRTAHRVYEEHTEPGQRGRDFAASLNAHMLNTDPPEHTRLRALVGRAFTPRVVEDLRPRLRELAAEYVTQFLRRASDGTADVVADLALPLPTAVICELMGIPQPDRHILHAAVSDLLSIGDTKRIDQASHTLVGLLSKVLTEKREQPGDDLLTGLLAAHDAGDRLSGPELVSMAMLLLVAGHDTTVNLLSSGALALLRHPDQAEELQGDPTLVAGAVEELLRYDGPVNISTFRFTTEPVPIGANVIPAHHPVVISALAANRDPARFAKPDQLDLRRSESGHLAFGHGVHHCLGAALARMELVEILPILLPHLSAMTLLDDPANLPWRKSILVRGLAALPIRQGPTDPASGRR